MLLSRVRVVVCSCGRGRCVSVGVGGSTTVLTVTSVYVPTITRCRKAACHSHVKAKRSDVAALNGLMT